MSTPADPGPKALEAINVTKTFKLYQRGGDRIREWLTFGQLGKHREVRALHDVSFAVRRGEALGIIGDNGSGKSTMLRVLGNILAPTRGKVRINYPVSVLIELNAGYDIQATGRDNIIFQCRLLGMSSAEIDQRMEQIADFAELGQRLDMPMKTYSTGMGLRLAFSVALGLRRDIMLIDEVLAVGDEYFQSKCFKEIKKIKQSDHTIVYVSHALGTVRSVCERCVWLREGEVAAVGEAWEVIDQYMDYVRGRMGLVSLPLTGEVEQPPKMELPEPAPEPEAAPEPEPEERPVVVEQVAPVELGEGEQAPADSVFPDQAPAPEALDDEQMQQPQIALSIPDEPSPMGELPCGVAGVELTDHALLPWARQGSHEIEIYLVQTLDGLGREKKRFVAGEPLTIRLHYIAHEAVQRPNFGVAIYRNDGVLIYGTSTQKDGLQIQEVFDRGQADFVIPELGVLSGSYEITVAVFDEDDIYKYDYHTRLYPFTVTNRRRDEGTMRLTHSWEIKKLG